MRALDRKLWRDLWHMRGQAVAIALVVMCGVATHVMFLSTLNALRETQQGYYREYRFADVFVSLKRAPEALRERIAALPGVARADTRVVAQLRVVMPEWSNAPPATKDSHRASAAALNPPSIASGESPTAARMALMFSCTAQYAESELSMLHHCSVPAARSNGTAP